MTAVDRQQIERSARCKKHLSCSLIRAKSSTIGYYDEEHADRTIRTISASAWALWQKLKRAAHAEVDKLSKR